MVYFVTQGAKNVMIYRGRMREMYPHNIFLRIRDWIDGSSQEAGSFLALKEWRDESMNISGSKEEKAKNFFLIKSDKIGWIRTSDSHEARQLRNESSLNLE